MTTVACVLRSGGWCGAADVLALQARLAVHCGPHRFVCLTDTAVDGVETVPLAHDWPGWFSKIELFRPGLFTGPVLYLDLDTVVVGDVLHMAGGAFAMLDDFYRPNVAASGVMAWSDDAPASVYTDFAKNPDAYMECHRRGGDQSYIRSCVVPDRLQARHPGQIVSWKIHCRDGVPASARLVCFHGKPKWDDLSPQDRARLAA